MRTEDWFNADELDNNDPNHMNCPRHNRPMNVDQRIEVFLPIGAVYSSH
jgi:hypothetical protein